MYIFHNALKYLSKLYDVGFVWRCCLCLCLCWCACSVCVDEVSRKPTVWDREKSACELFARAGEDLSGRCCNHNFITLGNSSTFTPVPPCTQYRCCGSPLNSFLVVWLGGCLGERSRSTSRLWTWRPQGFFSSSLTPLQNKLMLGCREPLTSATAGETHQSQRARGRNNTSIYYPNYMQTFQFSCTYSHTTSDYTISILFP